jgi:hypothetical protein
VGGRQAVRPRTLDPVSKVRILPAQPVFQRWPREHHQAGFQAPFKSERRPHFIRRGTGADGCENRGERIASEA